MTASGNFREQIAYSERKISDPSQGDTVFELTIMVAPIDLFPPEKVSAMILEAAEVMKACKALLDKKRKLADE